MKKHNGIFLRNQRGFTLVEIMVALLIGIVLLAGISQLLVGNRNTYRFQSNLSRLQENGRYALEMLSRNLRMAGFRSYPNTPLTNGLAGVENGTSDEITIRYQSAIDCLGNNVAGALPIANNQFSIANSNGIPNLYCSGNGGGSTPQPLIEGVESMDILYGEDTDSIKDGIANRYISADTVTNWADIVSARIQLVLFSIDNNLTDVVTAYGDRRIRRTFTSTVTLRNSDVNIAELL